jgi:hypothetical protein
LHIPIKSLPLLPFSLSAILAPPPKRGHTTSAIRRLLGTAQQSAVRSHVHVMRLRRNLIFKFYHKILYKTIFSQEYFSIFG